MISEGLEEALRYNSFSSRHTTRWAAQEHRYLSKNNVFNKAMIVNMCANGISFIPTALYPLIYRNIDKLSIRSDSSLICPLTISAREEKKAPDTIIKRLFSIEDARGLIKVITGKGTDYIGGSGLIFDQDWVPLMMTGIDVLDFPLIGEHKAERVCPRLFVNPEVFTREDSISRVIIKKLIPWYSTHFVHTNILEERSSEFRQTVRISVEDFSHMFLSPKAPNGNFNAAIQGLCREQALNEEPEDYDSALL